MAHAKRKVCLPMQFQRIRSRISCVAAFLVLALAFAGCDPPPGTPATRGKALERALRMMYRTREMVNQRQHDVAAENAHDVARYLEDSRLNEVPDIQSIRDDWKKWKSDLDRVPPPDDLAERLDALIRRFAPLVPTQEGDGS